MSRPNSAKGSSMSDPTEPWAQLFTPHVPKEPIPVNLPLVSPVTQEPAETDAAAPSSAGTDTAGARSAAPHGHGYTWADAREIKAIDLKTGDTFVKPGLGAAYVAGSDGCVPGAGIAWESPMDGTAWTVVARQGKSVTAVSHTARMVSDELPPAARVLRVAESPAPAEPVLAHEPWRGGQLCGVQTAYGMPGMEFCGRPKALGLRLCQGHHDEMHAEIPGWVPGNAEGLAIVSTIHGWSVFDQYSHLCASADDRASLERTYGFTLTWEGERGEPVEPTGSQHAA